MFVFVVATLGRVSREGTVQCTRHTMANKTVRFGMKAPKPAIPKGAPPGTVWFGGPIEWFRISLGITAEDLVPDDVSRVMRREPDECQQKGKPVLRADGTVMRIARFGALAAHPKPRGHRRVGWR